MFFPHSRLPVNFENLLNQLSKTHLTLSTYLSTALLLPRSSLHHFSPHSFLLTAQNEGLSSLVSAPLWSLLEGQNLRYYPNLLLIFCILTRSPDYLNACYIWKTRTYLLASSYILLHSILNTKTRATIIASKSNHANILLKPFNFFSLSFR